MSQHEALRDRIIAAFDAMPPQLQQAARHVLDHPDDIALLSMREVARQAGVQPATMTRLAKFLDLAGYEQLRASYAQAVRARTEGFARQQQRLGGEHPGLAQEMLQGLATQIAHLSEPALLARIEAAATRLAQARRIYVLGLRSSHLVAWHFQYVMSLLDDRVRHLDGPAGTLSDGLMRATSGDVLLAVSINPYARQALDLARLAHDRGVEVVAITDSEVSPLAGLAEVVILCPAHQGPTFFHTLVPALAASELLCGILANRDPAATLDALEKADQHLAELDTYARQPPPRTR